MCRALSPRAKALSSLASDSAGPQPGGPRSRLRSTRAWNIGASGRPAPCGGRGFRLPCRLMGVPAPKIREQLIAVLRAWGMSDAHAATTAEMMLETDLRGVDSHGLSMLPTYDRELRSGRLNMRPQWKTLRDGPSMALIDADASLGHPISVHAMNLAVDKCRESAVAIVSVTNSHHFGAAGCYARIAAERGVIGMVTS